MMELPCPWCGPRPESEFRCGGTAGLTRPPLDCADATWAAYLHERENRAGAHDERWQHSGGCGLWFHLRRDTRTHEVLAGWAIDAEAPAA